MKLTASLSRRLLLTAMSLSLSGVAGCAAPVPGTVATTVETAQAPAPAQLTEQPAAPGQVVPAGVAAAQALTLPGVVTFRGEALAGYGVKAYNPLTGAELPLASPAVTDGQGRFQANVTGLQAGSWVRLVATKGTVALEATTKAEAQTPELALTEVATVLSLVADGPLKVAGLVSAEQLGATADTYMAALAELKAPIVAQLAQAGSNANAIVNRPVTDKQRAEFEGALEVVVSNTGRSQALVDATLALVKAVSAQPHANQFSAFAIQAEGLGTVVRFLGTHLKAGLGGAAGSGLRITNVRTGLSVDAKTGNVDVVKKVHKNKKRDQGMPVRFLAPNAVRFWSMVFMGGNLPSVLTPPMILPSRAMEPGTVVDMRLAFLGFPGGLPEVGPDDGPLTLPAQAAYDTTKPLMRVQVGEDGLPVGIRFPILESISSLTRDQLEAQIGELPGGGGVPEFPRFGITRYAPLTQVEADEIEATASPMLMQLVAGMAPQFEEAGATVSLYSFTVADSQDNPTVAVPWHLMLVTNADREVLGYATLPASGMEGEIDSGDMGFLVLLVGYGFRADFTLPFIGGSDE